MVAATARRTRASRRRRPCSAALVVVDRDGSRSPPAGGDCGSRVRAAPSGLRTAARSRSLGEHSGRADHAPMAAGRRAASRATARRSALRVVLADAAACWRASSDTGRSTGQRRATTSTTSRALPSRSTALRRRLVASASRSAPAPPAWSPAPASGWQCSRERTVRTSCGVPIGRHLTRGRRAALRRLSCIVAGGGAPERPDVSFVDALGVQLIDGERGAVRVVERSAGTASSPGRRAVLAACLLYIASRSTCRRAPPARVPDAPRGGDSTAPHRAKRCLEQLRGALEACRDAVDARLRLVQRGARAASTELAIQAPGGRAPASPRRLASSRQRFGDGVWYGPPR